MIKQILNTLSFSKNLIISPDIDGFICSTILQEWNPDYKVVGTYDKNILTIADGYDIKDCLFIDCDMNRSDLVSIGNHMRLNSDGMSDKSFNPNVFNSVNKYSDKYPYATAFLITAATEYPTSEQTKLYMAYADSTYKNLEKYEQNMLNWQKRMNHAELDFVFNLSGNDKKALEALGDLFPKQAFVSKRLGKTNYLGRMNDELDRFGVNAAELTIGKKFLSDKVGKNTLIRYNQDVISYAEVFTGEYSVTYDEEVLWK